MRSRVARFNKLGTNTKSVSSPSLSGSERRLSARITPKVWDGLAPGARFNEVFCALYMRVGGVVDVRQEAAATAELVGDLFYRVTKRSIDSAARRLKMLMESGPRVGD